MSPAANKGFTLVEVIVVLVLTGILAIGLGFLITGPIQGFVDQSRRAELVDAADTAMNRMSRELRAALPNSVRADDDGDWIEFLETSHGARYRRGPGPGTQQPVYRLQPPREEQRFNAMGPATADLADGEAGHIAVYNTGQPDNDAWDVGSPGPMTAAGFSVNPDDAGGADDEVNIDLGSPHRFNLDSPRQRFYVVRRPVAYECDGQRLLRYADYDIEAAEPAFDGTGVPAAAPVVECEFRYEPGTETRASLVSIRLSLEEDGERVSLLRQVHVSNVP